MTNEEILKLVSDKPDSYVQIIKAYHKEFYDNIKLEYTGDKFGEKLYRFINKDAVTIGTCRKCGNPTRFQSFIVGFVPYCSKKCSNSATSENRSATLIEKNKETHHLYYDTIKCAICGKEFEALKYRKQKCCSGACSGKYVAMIPNRTEKMKKTKLDKYGEENYVNPEKAKQTCIEKYGIDNVFKFRKIQEKIKETNMKNYGTEWFFASDVGKEKIKESIQEKYGVDNVSQSSEIQGKIKQTMTEKYGVDNIFKHKPTMAKIYDENIKKYGAKIPVNGDVLKKQMMISFKKMIYTSIIERLNEKSECVPLFTIDDYVSTFRDNKYKFQCKKCNDVFEDHIDGGHLPRCLKCDPLIAGFSNAEKEIAEYVKSIVGEENVIENDREVLDGLELDVYIPSKKIAIEYDGLYWHGEHNGKKARNYHLSKTVGCMNKGVKLLHIFEDEWNNKKELVKTKISHIIGGIDKTEAIYARKCIIKPIKNCSKLLNENHIQGNCPASIKLGAFYDNELVAVMTLGNRRVAMGKKTSEVDEYELLRFATNKRVVGIASKLFSYFVKEYHPQKITTYADRRFSVGNLYEKLGFTKVSETQPNYWYFKIDNTNKRWHRFNFRKQELPKKLETFDINLTEFQNMVNNGYDRIWDCGNIKYEWKQI